MSTPETPETTNPAAPASLLGLIATPKRRTLLQVVGAAVLISAGCWYFGANLWHSILFGGALTTVGFLAFVSTGAESLSNIRWRDQGRNNRHGARNEVSQLSSSLCGSYGRVGGGAQTRVRQLARYRLALHQLDLSAAADREAIEQLIGRGPYRILAGKTRRRPLLRSLLHCLDVLDALDGKQPAAPPPPSARQQNFALNLLRRARER
jgi:hypothetical protein